MPGTVTTTYNYFLTRANEKINIYQWSCTTISGGTCSGTGSFANVTGEIIHFEAIPDGTDTPTDSYNAYIHNANSYDMLHGVGVDLSDSAYNAVNRRYPKCNSNLTNDGGQIFLYKETLTPYIVNAGDFKTTVLKLYIKS